MRLPDPLPPDGDLQAPADDCGPFGSLEQVRPTGRTLSFNLGDAEDDWTMGHAGVLPVPGSAAEVELRQRKQLSDAPSKQKHASNGASMNHEDNVPEERPSTKQVSATASDGSMGSEPVASRSNRRLATNGTKGTTKSGSFSNPGDDSGAAFLRDLAMWAEEYNESFHIRIWLREFVGQTLHHILWVFSLPLLYFIYDSHGALVNRGFVISKDNRIIFVFQNIISSLGFFIFLAYLILQPPEKMETEYKFFFCCVIMRTTTIAFKYANMTTEMWSRTNRGLVDAKNLQPLLLGVAWYIVPPRIMEMHAEISSVGILGTRSQRERLSPTFVPWPEDIDDLNTLRHRVDVTTRRLLLKPTGHIYGKGASYGQPRRLVVERLANAEDLTCTQSKSNNAGPAAPERAASVSKEPTSWGMPKTGSTAADGVRTASSAASLPTLWQREDIRPVAKPDAGKHIKHYRMATAELEGKAKTEEELRKRDEAFIAAAGTGQRVPIEELFLFFLRSLLRSEDVVFPKALMYLRRACGIGVGFSPLILRLALSESGVSVAYVILMIVMGCLTSLLFVTNVLFIEVGARDMWRRRALMRSCAALLTLSREWRRGCPVEVDQLPVLDMADPRSIEAWRKLRQLCMDWGRFFYDRIQQFAASYTIIVALISGDMMLSLTVPEYEREFPVTLQKLVVFSVMFLSTGACLSLLVFFGQEVNEATYNHVALLQRQRMLLLADSHIQATKAEEEGEKPQVDSRVERAVVQLEAVCMDLQDYHAARPVKLLGLYCGYSLFTSMYFVPATLVFTVASFCSKDESAWKCTSLGG